ncbi:hypothetical protein MNV49_005136 [Pseudohyphozyma bogoriensis]|nr:hypothetical protein MNV49_005136 [Pseudohyphozyma bogoriensis]
MLELLAGLARSIPANPWLATVLLLAVAYYPFRKLLAVAVQTLHHRSLTSQREVVAASRRARFGVAPYSPTTLTSLDFIRWNNDVERNFATRNHAPLVESIRSYLVASAHDPVDENDVGEAYGARVGRMRELQERTWQWHLRVNNTTKNFFQRRDGWVSLEEEARREVLEEAMQRCCLGDRDLRVGRLLAPEVRVGELEKGRKLEGDGVPMVELIEASISEEIPKGLHRIPSRHADILLTQAFVGTAKGHKLKLMSGNALTCRHIFIYSFIHEVMMICHERYAAGK